MFKYFGIVRLLKKEDKKMARKAELDEFLDKDLWEYEAAKYWMGRLRSEGNRRKCKRNFPDFIAYVKMNPDDIIAQRREDLRSDDPKIVRRWEDIVLRFYHENYERYEKTGKSTWTARTKLSAVQSFFAKHHYNLKFERGEVKKAYTKRKKYEVSNEEARAIYQSLEKWRDRAMFLLGYQNGLLEADICNLNAEDFSLEKLRNPPLYYETVRQKTKTGLQTAFGKDVCFAIERMLRIEGSKEGPLFQSVHGERMTPRFVRDAIMPIAKAMASESLQFKDLRDAFHDACNKAMLSQRTIDALMGHTPLGARGAYTVRKGTILEGYGKVYWELTIDETRSRGEENEEFDKMLIRLFRSDDPRGEAAKILQERGYKVNINVSRMDIEGSPPISEYTITSRPTDHPDRVEQLCEGIIS